MDDEWRGTPATKPQTWTTTPDSVKFVESSKPRPWWKWKSSIGSALLGLSYAISTLPNGIAIGSVKGFLITPDMVAGFVGAIGIALGGVGIADKIERKKGQ